MKKLVFCIALSLVTYSLSAQTYYNMWRGDGASGQPEWIANSAMSYGFSGIQFTTADKYRGHISGGGQWFGRNRDVTFNNQVSKWLRINSYGGIACWGNGLANENDLPNLMLTGTELRTSIDGMSTSMRNVNNSLWFGTTNNAGIEIGTHGTTAIYIGNGQNIFFGFDKNSAAAINNTHKLRYRLFVDKGILSEDYAIAPKSAWADFVFAEDYELKPLSELELFIVENQHLPDVPSAEEISVSGYSQHDMNAVLLQKIEELTLYVISQQKEIDELKAKINTYESGKDSK